MDGPPLPGVLGWGEHPEGGLSTVVLVLLSPVGHEHLGFEQGVELLGGEHRMVAGSWLGGEEFRKLDLKERADTPS